jgi:hypothetical protein
LQPPCVGMNPEYPQWPQKTPDPEDLSAFRI